MERIKYTCANCGWETSVTAQWKDLKPKRCMNKKCNTSFRANPEALKSDDPTLRKKTVEKAVKKVMAEQSKVLEKLAESEQDKKDEKSSSSKKTSSKQKTSSKTEQQQDEKKASE